VPRLQQLSQPALALLLQLELPSQPSAAQDKRCKALPEEWRKALREEEERRWAAYQAARGAEQGARSAHDHGNGADANGRGEAVSAKKA
jgi:hypothetical protein